MVTPMTIDQVANHFKGTGLARTAIRRALLRGEIPYVACGRKYLVTLEAVEDWLRGAPAQRAAPPPVQGVRRVAE